MSFYKSFSNVCVLIGAYSLFNVSHDLYSGYSKYYTRPHKELKDLYGPGYVLIIGATDSLGLAYAHEFASKGHNLLLLSRNELELIEKKEEMEKLYKIKIETIAFDLTNDEKAYDNLAEELEKYEVSMLVNNAVIFNEKNCGNLTFDEIKNLIIGNCLSPLLLSKIFWTKFKGKKTESAIINIGSQYADRKATDQCDVYFASKNFNNIFSKSLSAQILKPKIEFITIFPGMLRNESLRKFMKENEGFVEGLMKEDPNYFAKQTVGCLGYDGEIYGSQRQAFMHYLFKNIVNPFYEF